VVWLQGSRTSAQSFLISEITHSIFIYFYTIAANKKTINMYCRSRAKLKPYWSVLQENTGQAEYGEDGVRCP
jgi:hypothetical protein